MNVVPELCGRVPRHHLRVTVDQWVAAPAIRRPRSALVDARNHADRLSVVIEQAKRAGAAAVVIIVDADDDSCAQPWAEGVRRIGAERGIAAAGVWARRELEAWLLASLADPGLPLDQIEVKRDAKRIFADLGHDAAYVAKRHDVATARIRARSFDKLVREVARLVGVEAPPRGP